MTTEQQGPTPTDIPRIVGVLQEGQRQIKARLGGIEQNQRETDRRIDENQRETNRRFDETNHRIDRVLYSLIAVGTVFVGGLIANAIVA